MSSRTSPVERARLAPARRRRRPAEDRGGRSSCDDHEGHADQHVLPRGPLPGAAIPVVNPTSQWSFTDDAVAVSVAVPVVLRVRAPVVRAGAMRLGFLARPIVGVRCGCGRRRGRGRRWRRRGWQRGSCRGWRQGRRRRCRRWDGRRRWRRGRSSCGRCRRRRNCGRCRRRRRGCLGQVGHLGNRRSPIGVSGIGGLTDRADCAEANDDGGTWRCDPCPQWPGAVLASGTLQG